MAWSHGKRWSNDDVESELRRVVAEFGGGDSSDDDCMCGYGYFNGGDPRHFFPDTEMCTEGELEAHRRACDAWDRNTHEGVHTLPERGSCTFTPEGTHVARPRYGMGTYVCEACRVDKEPV